MRVVHSPLPLALSFAFATACSSSPSPADGAHGTDAADAHSLSDAHDTSVDSPVPDVTHADTPAPDTSSPDVPVAPTDAAVITPGDPGASDVQFGIDSTMNVAPISAYVYGLNAPDWTANTGVTITRFGGNRVTAYDWENNASNAGSDYMFENDDYLCSDSGCNQPGETVRRIVAAAQSHDSASLIAVPMAGYVSADTGPGGDVRGSGTGYLMTRFRQSVDQKGSPFTLTPSLTDAFVYQDEFVNWLETTFPHSRATPDQAVFYQLDNEPDLWSSTHAEIHPVPVTYAEMVTRSTALATAIKAVASDALVFGFISYGWAGYESLQNATDAMGRNFIDFFLTAMHTAETTAGMRLLDALDLHWYPEATGGGVRITGDSTNPTTEAQVIAARVQAPRSLWDSSYVENSWITSCCGLGAIHLVPRLMAQIATDYPGTKLAFSEYNYGGANDVSGAIAEADVLGIFGREGVYAACEWPLADAEPFIIGGFETFRNYDGAGSTFGNTTIAATNSDSVNTSVYASLDSGHPERMVVVAINKTAGVLRAGISVTHTERFTRAEVYRVTSASATPAHGTDVAITATNAFVYPMPANSVSTLVLLP